MNYIIEALFTLYAQTVPSYIAQVVLELTLLPRQALNL